MLRWRRHWQRAIHFQCRCGCRATGPAEIAGRAGQGAAAIQHQHAAELPRRCLDRRPAHRVLALHCPAQALLFGPQRLQRLFAFPWQRMVGRQFNQHVGQQLGIGLHQAGTDDALDQITAAGHQPPAQLQATASTVQSTVDIALHVRQRACAGGVHHHAIGRQRDQNALALRRERRHEVVRFGQLIQPRMQLLVAGVGLHEALRVRADLDETAAGGRPATGTGPRVQLGMVGHQVCPAAASTVWVGLPAPYILGQRLLALLGIQVVEWQRPQQGITVVPGRRQACFQSLLRLQPRFGYRPHARGAPHHDGQHQQACQGPAQSAQNLQHSFPSMCRCRSRFPSVIDLQ